MKQRISTGIILTLLFFPILIFGHHYYIFDIACFALSVVASMELTKLFSHHLHLPWLVRLSTILLTAFLFTLVVLTARYNLQAKWLLGGFMIIILVQSFYMVIFDEFKAIDFGNQLLIILYGSLGFAAFAHLRFVSLHAMLYLLLVAMMTDTFAYFFGIRFGKHKLAPKVSPKKSIEGAVAGLFFGGGLASVYAIIFPVFPQSITSIFIVLLSFFLSFVAQLGDLVASKLKRSFGAKDFSNLFPGHGGVLDRFDSSLYAAMTLLILYGFIQGFGL